MSMTLWHNFIVFLFQVRYHFMSYFLYVIRCWPLQTLSLGRAAARWRARRPRSGRGTAPPSASCGPRSRRAPSSAPGSAGRWPWRWKCVSLHATSAELISNVRWVDGAEYTNLGADEYRNTEWNFLCRRRTEIVWGLSTFPRATTLKRWGKSSARPHFPSNFRWIPRFQYPE